MAGLLIGELAKRCGVTPATIRYYESLRLLKAPPRSAAGYRRYSETVIDELNFIRKAQGLGFSLEEIAGVLELTRAGKTPCDQVLLLARQHLTAVEERIRELQRFHAQLAGEIEKWSGSRTATCDGLCQLISLAQVRTPVPVVAGTRRNRPNAVDRRT